VLAKPIENTEVLGQTGRALSGKRPSLLLIDDSRLARQMFRRFFELRGFSVTEASGVVEARERIAAAIPDVIVCDLVLEDGTGLDVLEHLRQSDLDTRTILISGQADTDSVIRAHRLNVFDFVTKGEDPRHLLQSVERVVLALGSR